MSVIQSHHVPFPRRSHLNSPQSLQDLPSNVSTDEDVKKPQLHRGITTGGNPWAFRSAVATRPIIVNSSKQSSKSLRRRVALKAFGKSAFNTHFSGATAALATAIILGQLAIPIPVVGAVIGAAAYSACAMLYSGKTAMDAAERFDFVDHLVRRKVHDRLTTYAGHFDHILANKEDRDPFIELCRIDLRQRTDSWIEKTVQSTGAPPSDEQLEAYVEKESWNLFKFKVDQRERQASPLPETTQPAGSSASSKASDGGEDTRLTYESCNTWDDNESEASADETVFLPAYEDCNQEPEQKSPQDNFFTSKALCYEGDHYAQKSEDFISLSQLQMPDQERQHNLSLISAQSRNDRDRNVGGIAEKEKSTQRNAAIFDEIQLKKVNDSCSNIASLLSGRRNCTDFTSDLKFWSRCQLDHIDKAKQGMGEKSLPMRKRKEYRAANRRISAQTFTDCGQDLIEQFGGKKGDIKRAAGLLLNIYIAAQDYRVARHGYGNTSYPSKYAKANDAHRHLIGRTVRPQGKKYRRAADNVMRQDSIPHKLVTTLIAMSFMMNAKGYPMELCTDLLDLVLDHAVLAGGDRGEAVESELRQFGSDQSEKIQAALEKIDSENPAAIASAIRDAVQLDPDAVEAICSKDLMRILISDRLFENEVGSGEQG
ncbi:hypothetical protein [Roseiconus lacunae]|uniref:hypothetical protein n=1 Tax=Roseiconus lacunae TaxID=2605694 RepID=UPI001E389068|nr:hypothetical protein [Roseiconus lacunae]MCD0457850.1 hypothetical protein [Roseiconus lacunae]